MENLGKEMNHSLRLQSTTVVLTVHKLSLKKVFQLYLNLLVNLILQNPDKYRRSAMLY